MIIFYHLSVCLFLLANLSPSPQFSSSSRLFKIICWKSFVSSNKRTQSITCSSFHCLSCLPWTNSFRHTETGQVQLLKAVDFHQISTDEFSLFKSYQSLSRFHSLQRSIHKVLCLFASRFVSIRWECLLSIDRSTDGPDDPLCEWTSSFPTFSIHPLAHLLARSPRTLFLNHFLSYKVVSYWHTYERVTIIISDVSSVLLPSPSAEDRHKRWLLQSE